MTVYELSLFYGGQPGLRYKCTSYQPVTETFSKSGILTRLNLSFLEQNIRYINRMHEFDDNERGSFVLSIIQNRNYWSFFGNFFEVFVIYSLNRVRVDILSESGTFG